MKKTIVLLLLTLIVLAVGFADDGGTKYLENWSYGNIYVTEPNKEIALESEFLYVNQKRHTVRALFRSSLQFRMSLTAHKSLQAILEPFII